MEQLIPEEDGKMAVSGAEARNEMVLEGTNGAFSRVATMDAWGRELEIDTSSGDELFEESASFIVEALELGPEPSGDQIGVHLLVGAKMFSGCLVEKRFSKDGVAVVVIKNHDVSVALQRVVGKSTGLVGVDLARFGRDVQGAGEHLIGVGAIADDGGRNEVLFGKRCRWRGPGGLDVFPLLV
jgi:hypothetical protein